MGCSKQRANPGVREKEGRAGGADLVEETDTPGRDQKLYFLLTVHFKGKLHPPTNDVSLGRGYDSGQCVPSLIADAVPSIP